MELIVILIGILILARVGGELFERIGQPSIFGELLTGAILGVIVTYSTAVPIIATILS